jgi:hypothetical protein
VPAFPVESAADVGHLFLLVDFVVKKLVFLLFFL